MVKEKGPGSSSEYTRYLKQVAIQRLVKSDTDTQNVGSSRRSGISGNPFGERIQTSVLYRFQIPRTIKTVESYIINSVIGSRNTISGITFDNNGFLYFTENLGNRFNRLNINTGEVTTLLTGASVPPLSRPNGLDFDPTGNCIYISNRNNNSIIRYDLTTSEGSIYLGTGLLNPLMARFFNGLLYICDTGNFRIKTYDGTTLRTIAGIGAVGFNGDGDALTRNMFPTDLLFLGDAIYFTDQFKSHRIRVLRNGIITTIAGSDTPNNDGAYSGDGGLAINAQLKNPANLSYSSETNSIVFSDYSNNRIRAINLSSGIITTIAGTGLLALSGNGGNSLNAGLSGPKPIIVYNNNIYIGDQDNADHSTIRVLNPQYKTTTSF